MFISQQNNVLPAWGTDMSSRLARFLRTRGRPSAPVTNLEKGPLRKLNGFPFPSAAEPRNLSPGVSFHFGFILVLFPDLVGLVGLGEHGEE
jgi:hypothetical protein